MARPTGENLYAEDDYDFIPGAAVFFQPDHRDEADISTSEMDGLPTNPEDYLRSVQLEAKNCPDVVVANIDASKFKKSNAQLPKTAFQSSLPGSKHAPSKKWCASQLKAFSKTRQAFVKHLAQLKSINKQSKRRPKLPVYPLPAWDDQSNWKYFCLGNQLEPLAADLSNENLTHNDVLVDDNALDDLSSALVDAASEKQVELQETIDNDDNIINMATLEEGFPPMLRILLRMEPKQVQSNLAYQVEWLKTYGFSNNQGKWIYALMVCLEKPLYPSVISNLRDLSRQCAQLRTLAKPGSSEMNGLNLIICIVGKYFDQADLLDAM